MAHEFVILRKGILETYHRYEDIPLDLDHVIKFLPEIPEGPHTTNQHDEIEEWNSKLQALMDVERKNAKHI